MEEVSNVARQGCYLTIWFEIEHANCALCSLRWHNKLAVFDLRKFFNNLLGLSGSLSLTSVVNYKLINYAWCETDQANYSEHHHYGHGKGVDQNYNE